MIVRTAQIRDLQNALDASLARDLVDHLETHYPDVASSMTVADAQHKVVAGIARARTYGIDTRWGLAVFVLIMLKTRPGFDEHPIPRGYFWRNDGTGDDHIKWLIFDMTAEDWQRVISETSLP